MNKLLFVCTGNYYRSRFAEALFNHLAELHGLEWRAFSRGLAIHYAEGDLSPHTQEELERRSIPLHYTGLTRVTLQEEDLERAALVIALKEEEHRPMMREQFPAWERRIRYWNVHDVDVWTSKQALPVIDRLVNDLIDTLSQDCPSQRCAQA